MAAWGLSLAACGGDSDDGVGLGSGSGAPGAGGSAGSSNAGSSSAGSSSAGSSASGGSGNGGSSSAGSSSGGGASKPLSTCSAPCDDCDSCYEQQLCEGASHHDAVEACIDNPHGYEIVIVESEPFVIASGEETYKCQNFANPFGGKDVHIAKSESFMPPGSHHMFAFHQSNASDGELHTCSGLEFQRSIHTSQRPHAVFQYPEGVGTLVRADEGVRLNAHYLNTTLDPIEATVTTVFYVAPEGSVEETAAHLFFNTFEIFVPPQSPGRVQKTCTIPHDINLLSVTSHMHQYGTFFRAETQDGEQIYETTSWDEPDPALYEPAMALPAGTKITYWCEYENYSDQALTFGESAEYNEMCILSGRFYPADNGSIECF